MSDPRENCPWKCKHCLCYEGEIERLRDALKDLREAAAHVLANEPSDGIVGGPWLRSEYENFKEVERALGRRTP